MAKRTFPKEEIVDAIDSLEPVERSNWRHGTREFYVFERDGKHWKVGIDVHHSEGWQIEDEVVATEVKSVEKTITTWVHV